MPTMPRSTYENLSLERRDDVFILTLQKPPENRLTTRFCQEISRALNDARVELVGDSEGALIIRGNDTKFFCTVRRPVLGEHATVANSILCFPGPRSL